MGHEAIGVVEAIGADVRKVKKGDFVIMPFAFSDGTCAFCHEGLQTACIHGGFFGSEDVGGAQAEAIRIPLADGTLYSCPFVKTTHLPPRFLRSQMLWGRDITQRLPQKLAPAKESPSWETARSDFAPLSRPSGWAQSRLLSLAGIPIELRWRKHSVRPTS